MTAHVVLAFVLAWALSGCNVCWFFYSSEHKQKVDACTNPDDVVYVPPDEPPPAPEDPELHDLTCPEAPLVTDTVVMIDYADVQFCWVDEDPYGARYWNPSPPAEVASSCTDAVTGGVSTGQCAIHLSAPCEAVLTSSPGECVDDVTCAAAGGMSQLGDDTTWTDGSGLCVYDTSACKADRDAAVADLIAELDADPCALVFGAEGKNLHAEAPPKPSVSSSCTLADACDDPQHRVWVSGTHRQVRLDVTKSWVKLTTPYGVKTVPLSGSLAIDDVAPRRVLAAQVWGPATTTWNGAVFEHGFATVVPSSPIPFTKTGTTISVPPNAGPFTRAYIPDLVVSPLTPAWVLGTHAQTGTGTGTFTSSTFVYTYSQVWDGPAPWNTSVQVRLEGPVFASP